jgi:uncharacterized delta-60 repeat protein
LEPRTLLAAGQLDPAFDGDGAVLRPEAYPSETTAAASQPDGKVVLAGRHVTQPNRWVPDIGFGVARYNADGSLDTSFGSGGRLDTDVTAVNGGGEFSCTFGIDW